MVQLFIIKSTNMCKKNNEALDSEKTMHIKKSVKQNAGQGVVTIE